MGDDILNLRVARLMVPLEVLEELTFVLANEANPTGASLDVIGLEVLFLACPVSSPAPGACPLVNDGGNGGTGGNGLEENATAGDGAVDGRGGLSVAALLCESLRGKLVMDFLWSGDLGRGFDVAVGVAGLLRDDFLGGGCCTTGGGAGEGRYSRLVVEPIEEVADPGGESYMVEPRLC
jgi:hypothetical protein